jgi:hypothetical protein
MRYSLLRTGYTLLLIALAGCAGAPPPDSAVARAPVIFDSKQTGAIVGEQPRPAVQTFAAPPTMVWSALRKVLLDLEIPVTVENPTTHQIGNPSFYKARRMAGEPMETFIDCGMGMVGPKAASYRIYMSLLTTITSDGKSTTAQTMLLPVGQDMSGGAADRISCTTNGKFERLMLERVKSALGTP